MLDSGSGSLGPSLSKAEVLGSLSGSWGIWGPSLLKAEVRFLEPPAHPLLLLSLVLLWSRGVVSSGPCSYSLGADMVEIFLQILFACVQVKIEDNIKPNLC